MDRRQQQAELLYQLGQLLAPLQEVIDYPNQHTPQTRAKATAKFSTDYRALIEQLRVFARDDAGNMYQVEFTRARQAINQLQQGIGTARDDNVLLASIVALAKQTVQSAILAMPVDPHGAVLEASSPFQAYCKLKSYFETTARTLIWADPYMGDGLFHRYLNGLGATVSVTLITTERPTKQDYRDFLDISKLYAQERGTANYRLMVESTNHDRWLRCDDQLYHLGGSAKDAGQRSPFTITKIEATPANFKSLDDLLAASRELFGPANPIHP
jgi:hypothetical protein